MSHEKYFEAIDSLYEKYLRVWEAFCNIESPTDYKAGVDACGEYMINIARELGFEVEVCRQEVSGDAVCITLNPDAQGTPICVSGHMDTVHPVGSFGSPAVRVEGDKMYGPGVTDCKGGIVAGMLALEALQKAGYKKRPVRLLLQADEENGSKRSNKATIKYICERAQGAEAFLNLEGHGAGTTCIQRKGIITFRLTVTGVAAHSCNVANEGSNAIADAAYKIIEIEKIKDDAGVTCNCGVISGGTVVNSVPDHCEFMVNVRYATSEQLEWIKAKINEIAATEHIKGCHCEVSVESFRVAMEYSERNIELLEKVNRALERAGVTTLRGVMRKGDSDAADVTSFGIPCLDSIGVKGGEIHKTSEFAYLESLREAAQRVVAVAEYM
ncbi:MAG: M20/M25/M40 family metallo-hydrolase [Clostridia bacterium]|nr:M20/M25/M40 family metallo-hydrolase [Clostridia bacterium]